MIGACDYAIDLVTNGAAWVSAACFHEMVEEDGVIVTYEFDEETRERVS